MYINKTTFRETWRAYAETLTYLPLTDDQLRDFIRRDTYGQYNLKDHEYTWLVELIREMEA